MLKLRRYAGESIVFPQADIEVAVSAVDRDGTVHLSISAPNDVDVYRREVWIAICRDEGLSVTGGRQRGSHAHRSDDRAADPRATGGA